MALNYPSNPSSGDTFTDGTTTWQWDGTSWNVVSAGSSALQANTFKNISSDSGVTAADNPNDTLTVTGSGGITTAIAGDTLTISYAGGGGGGNQSGPSPIGGAGGSGGGGQGSKNANGQAGTANTGGGGGGSSCGQNCRVAGSGGKGVVILRYKFK